MSLRTVLIIALALVCGLSAVWVANIWANNFRPEAVRPEMVQVVVAAADIQRGATLNGDLVKLVDWPKDRLPPGALTRVEDAADRVLLSTLVKGEPVLDAKLAARGSARGMSALLPKGMRAFTIQTPNPSAGGGGFVLPGNKVDVLLTVTAPNDDPAGGGPRIITLLQNVEVLAVGPLVEAPADNKTNASELRSVTLLVTPEQVARLTLGQTNGQLHLSLRNSEDQLASDAKPTTLAEIGQFEKKREDPKAQPEPLPPAVQAPPPPEPAVVRTLRGRHEGEVTITPAAPPASDSNAGVAELSEAMRKAMEKIKGK
jgi:pilus assembly protein CpaB